MWWWMKMDGCWVEENDESYQVCMRWWFMWSVWCGYENEIDVRREVRRCLSFMWFVFVTHSDCVFVMSTEYTLFDKRIDFSIEWSLIGKQSTLEISIWLEYYWIDHTLMLWIQLLWLLEQKWRSVLWRIEEWNSILIVWFQMIVVTEGTLVQVNSIFE